MLKPGIIVIISFLFIETAFAQKKSDTSIYYLTAAGKVVSVKDSADFFLVILPPDTSIDKKLYRVNEYYSNGKPMMMTSSKTSTLNMKFQGIYISFYPNGHKKLMMSYENGKQVGDQKEYYPTGKLYTLKKCTKGDEILYDQCRDTTGKVLAENGKGKWIEFNSDFSAIIAEGPIDNGVREGTWRGRMVDNSTYEVVYIKGQFIKNTLVTTPASGADKIIADNSQIFTSVEKMPEFPGGMESFYRFIGKNMRYPAKARENGTQGKVIISMTVEKDGSLTDMAIIKSIGDGCDEEAIRVMKTSPKWSPAIHDGKLVRVKYDVPLSFILNGN